MVTLAVKVVFGGKKFMSILLPKSISLRQHVSPVNSLLPSLGSSITGLKFKIIILLPKHLNVKGIWIPRSIQAACPDLAGCLNGPWNPELLHIEVCVSVQGLAFYGDPTGPRSWKQSTKSFLLATGTCTAMTVESLEGHCNRVTSKFR